eukprot:evm.model.NODE_17513_length_31895_cov_24.001411.10
MDGSELSPTPLGAMVVLAGRLMTVGKGEEGVSGLEGREEGGEGAEGAVASAAEVMVTVPSEAIMMGGRAAP